jgi:uncharacterized LabA/DUF88 family protein
MRTKYLFIDGGYLDEVLGAHSRDFFGGAELDINYQRIGSDFQKVFYYHCPPPEPSTPTPETEARKRAYEARVRDLTELGGWHVFQGITKRHAKRGNTQKEVDVQLAVDLLTHSFRGNMDEATLLTGDQDFRPVVEAVVREGMFLTLWSDPRTTSSELRTTADHRRSLDVWEVNGMLRDSTQACRVPQRSGMAFPNPPVPASAVETACTAHGLRFALFHSNSEGFFAVAQQREANLHFVYADRDDVFLKTFLAVQYGRLEWVAA